MQGDYNIVQLYPFSLPLSDRKELLLGEKDILEKSLEDYNDIFADIINGLIFDGEDIVDANGLVDIHPVSFNKPSGSKLITQERDAIKNWQDNLIYMAVFGTENQSSIYKYMPIRVIGYDGSSYRKQITDYEASVRLWEKNSKKDYSTGKTVPERPVFHPIPVVTLVLYFGKTRWLNNHRLKELLDIPEKLAPYVSDYKINVFEIAWLTDEVISRFKSDFRIVANFFHRSDGILTMSLMT